MCCLLGQSVGPEVIAPLNYYLMGLPVLYDMSLFCSPTGPVGCKSSFCSKSMIR